MRLVVLHGFIKKTWDRASMSSSSKMATLLKTSRTQVDRLLDPQNDITLGTLQRAGAA